MTERLPRQPNVLLKQARKARGWTQSQLAELMGVSTDAVRSWESGRQLNPLPAQRIRLCEIFQMPPEQLGLLPWAERLDEDVSSPTPSIAVPEEARDALDLIAQPDEAVSYRASLLFPDQDGDKNRHRLLSSMWDIWIEGVLKRSLRNSAIITLDLMEMPDALANPWQNIVQEMRRPPYSLPAGTSIVQVYDDAQGELLLLGEPGSGKSTYLLDLARVLLLRAGHDSNLPLPVVVNLSFWTTKHVSFAAWLIDELQSKYRMQGQVVQTWVETGHLTILFDGLDEMALPRRSACLNAITLYQREHAAISLVICCRQEEYYAQATRLRLQRAVLLQPLTRAQIDEYLSFEEEHFAGARQVLDDDPEWLEMLQHPFMLDIFTQVFEGKSPAEVAQMGSKEGRRHLVLNAYVPRMLTRRGVGTYSHSETVLTLSWLAWHMQTNHQAVFSLQQVQPGCLREKHSVQHSSFIIACFLWSLTTLSLAALADGLAFWAGGIHQWSGLSLGFVIVLVFAFFVQLLLRKRERNILEHFLLRWYFWRKKLLPWKYEKFLDYASERILLQKIDTGYTFLHEMVLEYFVQKNVLRERDL